TLPARALQVAAGRRTTTPSGQRAAREFQLLCPHRCRSPQARGSGLWLLEGTPARYVCAAASAAAENRQAAGHAIGCCQHTMLEGSIQGTTEQPQDGGGTALTQFSEHSKADGAHRIRTCIRHLLTSLAQRALLQPVDDGIHSRNRRTVTVGAVMYCDLMFPA
ncbi:hypothetical protein DV515_00000149, partial [Chloebia gouldiae]